MIKYNAPELEVITFTAEDIITASGVQAPATPNTCGATKAGYTCDLAPNHDGSHHNPNGPYWS